MPVAINIVLLISTASKVCHQEMTVVAAQVVKDHGGRVLPRVDFEQEVTRAVSSTAILT